MITFNNKTKIGYNTDKSNIINYEESEKRDLLLANELSKLNMDYELITHEMIKEIELKMYENK